MCGSLGGCAPHDVHHHQAHHGDGEVIRRDQPRAPEQAERRHPGRTTRPRRDECLDSSEARTGKQFRQHPGRFHRRNEHEKCTLKSRISRFVSPLHRSTFLRFALRGRKYSINLDRSTKHFTAAASKARPPPLGENQVSVAPFVHYESRLEGTLAPRLSRAHAEALIS